MGRVTVVPSDEERFDAGSGAVGPDAERDRNNEQRY
jgi:hypothetical protein